MRRVWIEIMIWQEQCFMKWSPSMRRVWIEIIMEWIRSNIVEVTLHAEGVD